METPQRIEVTVAGVLHWFEVHRFADEPTFIAALHKAGVHELPKNTASYTRCYGGGDEAGRMYLLDKSVGSLAREASAMAFGIVQRQRIELPQDDMETIISNITGEIASKLFSQQRYA